MEISSSTRCSRTRSSTPSYRPQSSSSHGSSASAAANACVSGRPCGDNKMRRGPGNAAPLIASTAAKIGSGFSTMPPPPPKGGSSVTRWRPVA